MKLYEEVLALLADGKARTRAQIMSELDLPQIQAEGAIRRILETGLGEATVVVYKVTAKGTTRAEMNQATRALRERKARNRAAERRAKGHETARGIVEKAVSHRSPLESAWH